MEAECFADKAFDAVAFDGSFESFFGDANHHTGCFSRFGRVCLCLCIDYPKGIGYEGLPGCEKGIDAFLRMKAFFFAQGVFGYWLGHLFFKKSACKYTVFDFYKREK